MIKFWLDWGSRAIGLFFTNSLWENGRKREICEWAGMQIPDDCPAVPRPQWRIDQLQGQKSGLG